MQVGRFDDEEDAARARDLAVLGLGSASCPKLNFDADMYSLTMVELMVMVLAEEHPQIIKPSMLHMALRNARNHGVTADPAYARQPGVTRPGGGASLPSRPSSGPGPRHPGHPSQRGVTAGERGSDRAAGGSYPSGGSPAEAMQVPGPGSSSRRQQQQQQQVGQRGGSTPERPLPLGSSAGPLYPQGPPGLDNDARWLGSQGIGLERAPSWQARNQPLAMQRPVPGGAAPSGYDMTMHDSSMGGMGLEDQPQLDLALGRRHSGYDLGDPATFFNGGASGSGMGFHTQHGAAAQSAAGIQRPGRVGSHSPSRALEPRDSSLPTIKSRFSTDPHASIAGAASSRLPSLLPTPSADIDPSYFPFPDLPMPGSLQPDFPPAAPGSPSHGLQPGSQPGSTQGHLGSSRFEPSAGQMHGGALPLGLGAGRARLGSFATGLAPGQSGPGSSWGAGLWAGSGAGAGGQAPGARAPPVLRVSPAKEVGAGPQGLVRRGAGGVRVKLAVVQHVRVQLQVAQESGQGSGHAQGDAMEEDRLGGTQDVAAPVRVQLLVSGLRGGSGCDLLAPSNHSRSPHRGGAKRFNTAWLLLWVVKSEAGIGMGRVGWVGRSR
ncbi:hypothetical protein V8C86DRAFT_335072 [Haematococcus lacustris]